MGSDTYLPYGVFFSCVDDVDDYFVVSLASHSEAGIEGIEYFAGVYEQSHASPTSYEDAAVATVVDAVAGFEHGAESGMAVLRLTLCSLLHREQLSIIDD